MKNLSPEEQKELIRRMRSGHEEVHRLRMEALRGKPYDWREVDTLLSLGEGYDGPPRFASGLVEMQRRFMKRYRNLYETRPDKQQTNE